MAFLGIYKYFASVSSIDIYYLNDGTGELSFQFMLRARVSLAGITAARNMLRLLSIFFTSGLGKTPGSEKEQNLRPCSLTNSFNYVFFLFINDSFLSRHQILCPLLQEFQIP